MLYFLVAVTYFIFTTFVLIFLTDCCVIKIKILLVDILESIFVVVDTHFVPIVYIFSLVLAHRAN